ncbi:MULTISPECIES: hypothetical protein [unclassified Caballeronia]|uniref:hypothetical protein n=1 Tax=unclassified Caballeronia TaxID=2646786 RepID=UPI002028CEB6|nr:MULTISPECIES: hypothetical protein [unclassified Caballeronia]
MTDAEIADVIDEFNDIDGYDFIGLVRAVERRTLERAKQLCEARAERAGVRTMLGYGVHIGAHHCAVEIDEAIRGLIDAQSGEEKNRG